MALFWCLRDLGSKEHHEGYYTKLRSSGKVMLFGYRYTLVLLMGLGV